MWISFFLDLQKSGLQQRKDRIFARVLPQDKSFIVKNVYPDLLVAKAKLGDKWMDPHFDIRKIHRQNDKRKKKKKKNSRSNTGVNL
jgi:hypothetical protein